MNNLQTTLALLTQLAPAMTAAKTALSKPASTADEYALVRACWQQVAKASPIAGVDALTTARVHALNFANTATFAQKNAQTEKQAEMYRSIAAAYYKIHDSLAGVEWYTLPRTRLQLRSESRQIQESAELRKLLAAIAQHLADMKRVPIDAKSRR